MLVLAIVIAVATGVAVEVVPFFKIEPLPFWPMASLAIAGLIVALSLVLGLSFDNIVFSALVVGCAYSDIEYFHIPDWLTIGAIIAFAFSMWPHVALLEVAVLLIGFVIYKIGNGSVGGGDIKMISAVSGFLGLFGTIDALFLSCVAVIAIVAITRKIFIIPAIMAVAGGFAVAKQGLLFMISTVAFVVLSFGFRNKMTSRQAIIPFGLYLSIGALAVALIAR